MSKIFDEFKRLKSINNEKMYLFRCGKFYIFIDSDCDLINEYVVLKKVPFGSTYKCGFPENVLQQYLKVFNNHNLDIDVIENIEDKNNFDIKKFLDEIDINDITPIEALIKLEILKESVK